MKMNNLLNKTILVCAVALLAQLPAWSAPEYTITDIFYSGDAFGYHTYRIPAIVRANDGTLLAFCEGRASNSDLGDIDIVLRRSSDNGVTWGPLIVVQSEGTISIGNPAPVIDRVTGDIHMLFCRENERIFHTVSTDNGLTWSTRTEITVNVKLPNWGWYATGPCHGVQLTRGEQAGRLVVAANHAIGSGASDTVEKGAQFIYSNDHGATWHMDAYFERADSDGGVAPNESTLVELNTPGDGGTNSHVYMNSRDYGTDPGNRSETWSGDGGGSFSVPYNGNPHFVTPICQGSLIRFSATDEGDAQNRIIFSSPNHGSSRENGSLWTTTNETATWSAPKQLFADGYAYSDMTKTASGHLGILAECNMGSVNYDYIKFIRVNEEWLDEVDTTPPTPNPATFAQVPVAINSATITMTATTGTDASNPVEYLFTETTGNPGGTSSGWTTSAFYMDTGLSPDTEYIYMIAMRDPHGNTGTNSTPESVTTPAGAPGLLGLNLSWEFDGVTSGPFFGWALTSLGSDSLDYGDFRTAADPDNWFPDSTAGNHVMLLEGDNTNEFGRLSQQLTGIAAVGTYLFTLNDVGVANFGDNSNAEFKFGFSLDGTNLITGSQMTLTEGTEIFSPDNGSVTTFSVSYTSNATDPLYLIIETTGAHTGRSVPTIGSTTLVFTPAGGDTQAPTPNPATFSSAPAAVNSTAIGMTSTEGTDASGPVEYFFAEISGNPGGTDSGWIFSPSYTDTGLSAGTEYTYTVQMRDALGNTTLSSASESATTPVGLTAQNLSWEDDGITSIPISGWLFTSLGSDSMDSGDFRVAKDPDNWFPDSTPGIHVLLMEGDNGNEYGRLSQQLTGVPATGSYTFSLLDVGVANFGDNNNAELKFGFSLDGTNLISGSQMTLTEGADIFSPDNGSVANFQVTYEANGTDPLYILIETTGAHTGRSVPTIGSTTLGFVAEPVNPPEAVSLTISLGADVVTVGSTNLSATAGITNTLQVTDDLIDGSWSNLYSVTGITETNWVLPITLPQSFYRIESTY